MLDVETPREATSAFGRRVRGLRIEQGVSQYELARRTDLHPTAIGRFERGVREPRLSSLRRLAQGLGVPPAVLVEDRRRSEA
jgi:XRE family transcriptional regulator, fatty acid utilization regulator